MTERGPRVGLRSNADCLAYTTPARSGGPPRIEVPRHADVRRGFGGGARDDGVRGSDLYGCC